MKEVPREKRFQVAHCYLLGYPYREIEAETGVSHGSVANIICEVESGKLTVAGTAFDQVNDLRQLSLDLKKKGLQPSQALLGLSLFERLRTLGITLEHLDSWSETAKRLAQPDFTPREFFEAALRLHELEGSQGKPFEALAEEYARLREAVDKLKVEVDSLSNNKTELIKELAPLRSQTESLERTKDKTGNEVEARTRELQNLKRKVKDVEVEKSRLDRETKELQRRRAKLSSEVDSKEESLQRLDEIGLSAEDLLRLTAFLERTTKNEGLSSSRQVRERFFSALALFEDVSGLEHRRKAEMQQVNDLVEKKSNLSGDITQLKQRKAILEGEIGSSTTSTSQRIQAIGEDAASQIEQQVTDVKNQLNGLLEDALRAGEAIGTMRQMVAKGEESGKSLDNLIKEVRSRMGMN